MVVRAYGAEAVIALTQLHPLITDMKNSWSNNFKAKVSVQHQAGAATEIASDLMDVSLMLHGLTTEDAYANLYKVIRPRLSCRRLAKEHMDVLAKIFGDFSGTGLTMASLEHGFLEKHPEYAHGTKRKRGPKVATDKVLVSGLIANLPDEYSNNRDLQESVKRRFTEYTQAVQEDFAAAGVEELEPSQMDSIMVGSMLHQYFGKGTFGEDE